MIPIEQNVLIKTRKLDNENHMKSINKHLEISTKDNLHLQMTAAHCDRTRWNMHEISASYELLGNAAIDFAQKFSQGDTDEAGNPRTMNFKVDQMWGLIYKEGSHTDVHHHWPSIWSFTYCVKACDSCAPLLFPTTVGKYRQYFVAPEVGQITLFPGHVHHSVPKQKCKHERIMIAGNIIMDGWNEGTNRNG